MFVQDVEISGTSRRNSAVEMATRRLNDRNEAH